MARRESVDISLCEFLTLVAPAERQAIRDAAAEHDKQDLIYYSEPNYEEKYPLRVRVPTIFAFATVGCAIAVPPTSREWVILWVFVSFAISFFVGLIVEFWGRKRNRVLSVMAGIEVHFFMNNGAIIYFRDPDKDPPQRVLIFTDALAEMRQSSSA